jgi:molecular chaperone GrpE
MARRTGGLPFRGYNDRPGAMTIQQDTPLDAADAPRPAEQSAAETLEQALADAEAKAQQHWNSYLRAVAETDNVRKRAQRDVEAASRYAVERFAGDLLEVRDSLELGLQAGAAADPARLVEGMEATLRLVNRAFEKAGVSVLDPLGEPFNPEFHEAMATQPTAEHPAGTVLAVVQKGYVLNGRLLRPARVLVAREPDAAGPDLGSN